MLKRKFFYWLTISNFLYIVILLILAAIAIASLTGDNGLFARAKQARQNTLDAQNAENLTLEEYEYAINDALYGLGTGGGSGETITGVDPEVTNPAGAMPTGATVIEGDASEGIVIRDENENEWVWVEVPKTSEVYSSETLSSIVDEDNITDDQCTTIYEDLTKYASAYRETGYEDTFYSTAQHGFGDATAYNTAKNNMIKSVYKNGGFWIGRYEVGDADATLSNTTRTDTTGTSNTALIKANQIPYNYVTCLQAQELATGLSTGGKTGSLMFGIQWDLTCKFLEVKTDLNEDDIKKDSTNWGNYNNSPIILSQGKYNTSPDEADNQWLDIVPGNKTGIMLLTTGASEDTNKMNIYDFAGNVWEFTLETYTNNTAGYNCVRRGGYYRNLDPVYPCPVSYHNNIHTTLQQHILGFRLSLY